MTKLIDPKSSNLLSLFEEELFFFFGIVPALRTDEKNTAEVIYPDGIGKMDWVNLQDKNDSTNFLDTVKIFKDSDFDSKLTEESHYNSFVKLDEHGFSFIDQSAMKDYKAHIYFDPSKIMGRFDYRLLRKNTISSYCGEKIHIKTTDLKSLSYYNAYYFYKKNFANSPFLAKVDEWWEQNKKNGYIHSILGISIDTLDHSSHWNKGADDHIMIRFFKSMYLMKTVLENLSNVVDTFDVFIGGENHTAATGDFIEFAVSFKEQAIIESVNIIEEDIVSEHGVSGFDILERMAWTAIHIYEYPDVAFKNPNKCFSKEILDNSDSDRWVMLKEEYDFLSKATNDPFILEGVNSPYLLFTSQMNVTDHNFLWNVLRLPSNFGVDLDELNTTIEMDNERFQRTHGLGRISPEGSGFRKDLVKAFKWNDSTSMEAMSFASYFIAAFCILTDNKYLKTNHEFCSFVTNYLDSARANDVTFTLPVSSIDFLNMLFRDMYLHGGAGKPHESVEVPQTDPLMFDLFEGVSDPEWAVPAGISQENFYNIIMTLANLAQNKSHKFWYFLNYGIDCTDFSYYGPNFRNLNGIPGLIDLIQRNVQESPEGFIEAIKNECFIFQSTDSDAINQGFEAHQDVLLPHFENSKTLKEALAWYIAQCAFRASYVFFIADKSKVYSSIEIEEKISILKDWADKFLNYCLNIGFNSTGNPHDMICSFNNFLFFYRNARVNSVAFPAILEINPRAVFEIVQDFMQPRQDFDYDAKTSVNTFKVKCCEGSPNSKPPLRGNGIINAIENNLEIAIQDGHLGSEKDINDILFVNDRPEVSFEADSIAASIYKLWNLLCTRLGPCSTSASSWQMLVENRFVDDVSERSAQQLKMDTGNLLNTTSEIFELFMLALDNREKALPLEKSPFFFMMPNPRQSPGNIYSNSYIERKAWFFRFHYNLFSKVIGGRNTKRITDLERSEILCLGFEDEPAETWPIFKQIAKMKFYSDLIANKSNLINLFTLLDLNRETCEWEIKPQYKSVLSSLYGLNTVEDIYNISTIEKMDFNGTETIDHGRSYIDFGALAKCINYVPSTPTSKYSKVTYGFEDTPVRDVSNLSSKAMGSYAMEIAAFIETWTGVKLINEKIFVSGLDIKNEFVAEALTPQNFLKNTRGSALSLLPSEYSFTVNPSFVIENYLKVMVNDLFKYGELNSLYHFLRDEEAYAKAEAQGRAFAVRNLFYELNKKKNSNCIERVLSKKIAPGYTITSSYSKALDYLRKNQNSKEIQDSIYLSDHKATITNSSRLQPGAILARSSLYPTNKNWADLPCFFFEKNSNSLEQQQTFLAKDEDGTLVNNTFKQPTNGNGRGVRRRSRYVQHVRISNKMTTNRVTELHDNVTSVFKDIENVSYVISDLEDYSFLGDEEKNLLSALLMVKEERKTDFSHLQGADQAIIFKILKNIHGRKLVRDFKGKISDEEYETRTEEILIGELVPRHFPVLNKGFNSLKHLTEIAVALTSLVNKQNRLEFKNLPKNPKVDSLIYLGLFYMDLIHKETFGCSIANVSSFYNYQLNLDEEEL
jgi:hypothetical protein